MSRNLEYHDRYHQLDDSHFWIASHHDMVMKVVQPLLRVKAKKEKPKILDVGCGKGGLLKLLIPWGEVVGIDASGEVVEFCRKEYNLQVECAGVQNLPFADNSFDFIFCVDLLEHVKDDIEVIKEMHRVLKGRGFLIVTVPAFMCLWGSHDQSQKHFRRYSRRGFKERAEKAGFGVRRISYFKFLLFLPLYFMRRIKKICSIKKDDLYQPPGTINKLLYVLLKAEVPIAASINLPWGSSLIAVLYKE